MRLKEKTELPLETLLTFAVIPLRTWREWQGRRGAETKHNNNIPRNYFINILDGYSRRILNWRLCDTMEGINAEVLVTETKEQYPEAVNPRLISDNGSQFISTDFQELLVMLEIGHTFTSACHPQSNRKLERFHRTFKTEHTRRSAYVDDADARNKMALWLAYYNSERLHSAIWYLTPDDVFYGRKESRLEERRTKLYNARVSRHDYWKAHAPNTAGA
jgi:transposase InsO family protein